MQDPVIPPPPAGPPRPAASPPPTWSRKRAALSALFAFIVVVSIGVGAYALLRGPASNDRLAGEGLGRLAVFAAAAGFLGSWLSQTGRRKAAIAVVAGISTLIVGLFIALAVVDRHGSNAAPAITGAERAPLVVVDEGGQRRLRHPAFGFSILHPGPGFKESAEVAVAMGMAGDPATQVYGFAEAGTGSFLVVSVMKGMGGSKPALEQHVDGVLRGMQSSLAGKAQVRVLARQTVWDDSAHVGTFTVALNDQQRLELAAYSVERPGQPPFVVNLMIAAPQASRFAALLASLRS